MNGVTASYLTLAGAAFGESAVHNVITRSAAAAAAGFTGIGACADEMLRDPRDYAELADQTAACPVDELEWYDLAKPDAETERELFKMADALGAKRVNVGVCDAHCKLSTWRLAARLRRFAMEAGHHGLTVAVEPVSFGSVWSPTRVCEIIRQAQDGLPDVSNIGFLWDMYHNAYAKRHMLDKASKAKDSQPGSYPTLPVEMIAEVQITGDGANAMERSTWSHSADQQAIILRDMHYQGPVSVEVTNSSLRPLSPFTMATEAMATVRQWNSITALVTT